MNRSRPALSPTPTFGNRSVRIGLQTQTEPCCQRIADKRLHLRDVQARTPIAEASHGPPGQTTGNDGFKPFHGAVHIQGYSVLGDPTPAPHTDGRHLALIEPDPCQSVDSLAAETKRSQHIDHHLLELTQIPVQVRAVATEIQHWINHKLPWSVMRHLSAAIDAVQRGGRVLGIEEEMVFRRATSQGVTGWVLQQQDRFGGRIAP